MRLDHHLQRSSWTYLILALGFFLGPLHIQHQCPGSASELQRNSLVDSFHHLTNTDREREEEEKKKSCSLYSTTAWQEYQNSLSLNSSTHNVALSLTCLLKICHHRKSEWEFSTTWCRNKQTKNSVHFLYGICGGKLCISSWEKHLVLQFVNTVDGDSPCHCSCIYPTSSPSSATSQLWRPPAASAVEEEQRRQESQALMFYKQNQKTGKNQENPENGNGIWTWMDKNRGSKLQAWGPILAHETPHIRPRC